MIRETRRTVALRPGATGLTPPSSRPASNPCLNCGTNVQLNYCPECGQRALDPDPTLREYLHELAETFLHWDGKLITTFRLLCTRPGALTQEYLAGRRARFITPLRLYLTCSVLFFFVQAAVPDAPRQVRASEVSSATTPATLDSLATSSDAVAQSWGSHLGKALRNQGELQRSLGATIPKAMFVLVPLFAALASLLFRARRMRYPQHLTFALHVHAFLFLALTLTLTARLTSFAPAGALATALAVAAVAIHLVKSVRGVYGTTLARAIASSALLSGAYFVLFGLALGVILVVTVLLRF